MPALRRIKVLAGSQLGNDSFHSHTAHGSTAFMQSTQRELLDSVSWWFLSNVGKKVIKMSGIHGL